jgi:SNF2 family DNA or RNA helicase
LKGAELSPADLQATFLPDLAAPANGVMVWWGGEPDQVAAARDCGLPEGAPGRLPMAVPVDATVRRVDSAVRLVPLTQAAEALATLRLTKHTSDSLRVWRAAAAAVLDREDDSMMSRLAEAMPPAGHAVCREPTVVWRPADLLSGFRHALHHSYLADDDIAQTLEQAQHATVTGGTVQATLRPYQRNGVAWLRSIAAHRRGGLLADDMGLGKTLQAIALLAGRQADKPHLVVCPTSVLGNWARELARFAPQLPVIRHHGPARQVPAGFEAATVVITSYSVLLRDIDSLSCVDWDIVILDEAQQIKNRGSQTARAARRLPAGTRLALTGTPVENRLGELWSIMDFANPGILGPYPRFVKRFAEPIESRRDSEVAARLRTLVRPYLLRRLKSDVATDLPAKQESIVSCTLTAEQAGLYKAAVRRSKSQGWGTGFERHGRVLKLLTELKQICNHPAHHLRQSGPLPHRSGKLNRATEMLAEAVAEGDQSLVFTQYRVMGDLLARHLSDELELPDVPFLHGGLSHDARQSMVDRFQSGSERPPILIVSLKAGGTGLNLTAATHVLHYDRWWNPAVEDQATDRAHRIGQTRPVSVYKLVTGGTLEERIADLLERKRSLADTIVGTGEQWISNLDDTRLQELIELSETEVAE